MTQEPFPRAKTCKLPKDSEYKSDIEFTNQMRSTITQFLNDYQEQKEFEVEDEDEDTNKDRDFDELSEDYSRKMSILSSDQS